MNALTRTRAQAKAPPPAPTTKVLTQPTIPSSTKWTVPQVTSAVDAHEEGDFFASALLAQQFGRDDRISACIDDRIGALTGAGAANFELVPAEFEPERSQSLVPALEGWWGSVVDDGWLRATLYDSITLGFSLSYIEWDLTAKSWTPKKLHHWHASAVRYDATRRTWFARTQSQGEIEVRPDDPCWFIYLPKGERSWLAGAIRTLGHHFVMRSWNYRDFARYCERHGLPILKIIEPSGEAEAGQKDAFYNALKRVGSNGTLRLPQGEGPGSNYDVDLLEAKARSWDAFVSFFEILNTAIAVRILGQNLSTEIAGGSFAAAGWHMRVRQDVVMGDASALADALRSKLIIPWAAFNVPTFDPQWAPWPSWQLELPEDKQATAQAQSQAASALQSLLAARIPVDIAAFAEKFGIPLQAIEDLPEEPEQHRDPLNGAQVTSLVEVVRAVEAGEIPRESGIAVIAAALGITTAEAEAIVATAGTKPPPSPVPEHPAPAPEPSLTPVPEPPNVPDPQ